MLINVENRVKREDRTYHQRDTFQNGLERKFGRETPESVSIVVRSRVKRVFSDKQLRSSMDTMFRSPKAVTTVYRIYSSNVLTATDRKVLSSKEFATVR